MIDCGDEYAMECTGQVEMDPDELNDLVADRDPHALEFFGLTEADEEELEEWDAHEQVNGVKILFHRKAGK